jgi:hypothetical protein
MCTNSFSLLLCCQQGTAAGCGRALRCLKTLPPLSLLVGEVVGLLEPLSCKSAIVGLLSNCYTTHLWAADVAATAAACCAAQHAHYRQGGGNTRPLTSQRSHCRRAADPCCRHGSHSSTSSSWRQQHSITGAASSCSSCCAGFWGV